MVDTQPDDTTVRRLRLLLNDTAEAQADRVFSDNELGDFLAIESGSLKRAAATAYDVIASNETLCAKVITDRRLSTNGAATAADLRKHATTLREQAVYDEDSYFGIVTPGWNPTPELSAPSPYAGYGYPWA